jgi:folate-binding protein YgfZ
MNRMARELALSTVHRSEGAEIRDVCGWALPIHYGDPAAEHGAVRRAVGLVDRSPVGKAVVTGRDRAAFLQGMLSNDVKALQPGQGCAAAFLDAHGKVMALLEVYALDDRLWLRLPPGLTEKTLQGLDRYLISEKAYFQAADDGWTVLAVLGPGAPALLAKLAGRDLELGGHDHVEVALGDVLTRVVNVSCPGLPGYECWARSDTGAALWGALRGAGAVSVGRDVDNILRVEAGVPWYGHDVDEAVILPETRLEHLVSYTKGCYIGQEVVARVKYRGHINRGLSGLVLGGERVPPSAARVTADGKVVGRVTSAVRSISLGVPIALGYVRREHFAPGARVEVADGDTVVPAQVAALPFVGQG